MTKEKKRAPQSDEILIENISIDKADEEPSRADCYELYVIEGGDGVYTVGNRSFPFFEGDILVISEGALHRINVYSDKIEAIKIVLTAGCVPEGVRSYFRESVPVIRSKIALVEIQRAIEDIKAERSSESAFRREKIKLLAGLMVISLARVENTYRAVVEASPAVTMALTFIKEHSSEKIILSDMAKMAKVSTEYLSRKFKKEVGMGFADYLSAFRLERARDMLTGYPEMSITEIAFSTGFNDSNYFSDKFKRKFGLSPLKYRGSKENRE